MCDINVQAVDQSVEATHLYNIVGDYIISSRVAAVSESRGSDFGG